MRAFSSIPALFATASLFAAPFPALAMASDSAPEGVWRGALETPAGDLRLELELEAESEGLSAVLISIDQGDARVPADEAVFDGADATLTLVFNDLQARYEAQFTQDRLDGVFTQAGIELPLVMEPGVYD